MNRLKPFCVLALALVCPTALGVAAAAQVNQRIIQTMPNPQVKALMLAPTAFLGTTQADAAGWPPPTPPPNLLRSHGVTADDLQAASSGNLQSMLRVGRLYASGRAGKRDDIDALQYFQSVTGRSTSKDIIYYAAEGWIGRLTLLGRGTVADQDKAQQLIFDAAKQGDPGAMSTLALMYMFGLNVPRDYGTAKSWLANAQNAGGDPFGTTLEGTLYLQGWGGVMADYGHALALFQQAGSQGDSDAWVKLGEMYMYGIGVGQDFKQARTYFLSAVVADNPLGMIGMGELDSRGWGLAHRNFPGAFSFYMQAAKDGLPWGEGEVGWYLYGGLGVPKDLDAAVKWATSAAAHGDAIGTAKLGIITNARDKAAGGGSH